MNFLKKINKYFDKPGIFTTIKSAIMFSDFMICSLWIYVFGKQTFSTHFAIDLFLFLFSILCSFVFLKNIYLCFNESNKELTILHTLPTLTGIALSIFAISKDGSIFNLIFFSSFVCFYHYLNNFNLKQKNNNKKDNKFNSNELLLTILKEKECNRIND